MASKPKPSQYDLEQQAAIDALQDQVNELVEERDTVVWLLAEQIWKTAESAKFMASNRKMLRGLYAAKNDNGGTPPQQPTTPAADTSQKTGKFRCGAGNERHYHDTVEEVRNHYRALQNQ